MKKVILTAAFSLVGVIAVSAQQSTPLEKPQDSTSNKPSEQYTKILPYVEGQSVEGQPAVQSVEGKKMEPLKEDKKYEKLKKKKSALIEK
jgi:ABC-type lipoprotein release transport system permease subunit